MLEFRHSSIFSRLRGLVEVTKLVRTTDDLDDLLAAVARTISESLGFRSVSISLYRPAWDDFVACAVHGGPETGETLLVPMQDDGGALLGIVSVGAPTSGQMPGGEEINVLVAAAEHAALAVDAAQEATQAKRHREALERLLEVSTRLTGTWQTDELLALVAESTAGALGFERVSIELLDRSTGLYVTGASTGFTADDFLGTPLSVADLDRLLQPEFDVAGCYLIPHERAREILPERPPGYRSKSNGRGPHAWANSWLLVPLHARDGERVGYIWVDDPRDRLLPGAEWLQLLRAFANQAAMALSTAAHLDALQASDARKDAILRSALDSLITLDHDGRVVEFNPAAEEVLGWTSADATGADFVKLAVSEEHRLDLADALAADKGPLLGTRFEIVALRADGRPFPAEASINRVDLPGPPIYAVSLRDITKRQDREERLREAEAKYRSLVEQIPLVTYINEIDLPLRTRYISPQIEAMLGYPVSRWLEPGFFPTILHPDDRERVLAESERTRRTGEGFRSEYRLIGADGRTVWVLDDTVAVRDDEYRPLLLQGFLLDVSERHAVARLEIAS